MTNILVFFVNEKLCKEEFIWFPNVVINDFNVKLLKDFVGFETNFAFKRSVITGRFRGTVYSFNAEMEKSIRLFFSKSAYLRRFHNQIFFVITVFMKLISA